MSLCKLIQFIGFFLAFSNPYFIFLFSLWMFCFPIISTHFLNSIIHPKFFQNCFTCFTTRNKCKNNSGYFAVLGTPSKWGCVVKYCLYKFLGFPCALPLHLASALFFYSLEIQLGSFALSLLVPSLLI